MPERETLERAREDAREGKSPSTQAREFLREEIHHVGKESMVLVPPQQAIATDFQGAPRWCALAPAEGTGLGPKKGRI